VTATRLIAMRAALIISYAEKGIVDVQGPGLMARSKRKLTFSRRGMVAVVSG
jgi:hypothetical protein